MHTTRIVDSSLQIPVIDIAQCNAQTADRLLEAVADNGFVFVRAQGLNFTSNVLDKVFDLVRLHFLIKLNITST